MSPDFEDERTDARLRAPVEEKYPSLEVIAGPKLGSFFLKVGKNFIGRSSENEIVLDDSSISRRHAVIEVAENGATIADLKSRNGTKVHGQKIADAVPLEHDTRIKIGVYQVRFLTGPAEPVEPEEVPEEPSSLEDALERGQVVAEPPAVVEEAGLPKEILRESERKQGLPRWLLYLLLGSTLVVTAVTFVPKLLDLFEAKKQAIEPTASKEGQKEGTVGGVVPGEKVPIPGLPTGVQPVFLDFSSTPIPAQVFFGTQPIGTTPIRISTNLGMGKWYEAKAVFQLPEVGEAVEEKVQFSLPTGATVLPVNFAGKIGIFKIASLPRDAQLYLEGYFEGDPYRAKPIKFAEIVFGKPLYVPFGRYILELRKSRRIGDSQTYLDEVVYRREFYVNATQTSYTVDVAEEVLKVFPVQITSIPPGAKVFIDENEVGQTPYAGSFPVGEHLLTMKREGYFDYVQAIKMQLNMPYVAEVPLKTSEAGELVNKADALMKDEHYAEALPILVEALSKNPSPRETAQISYLIGVCYFRQKSLKEARSYFLKAMEQESFKYAGRLGIASVTLEEGDPTRALQLLVEVLIGAEDLKVRADAGALFQRISPLKSVLYITSEPSGAKTIVNGTEVNQVTPLILHDLGVGSYRIQIRKEGHEETEVKLNLGVSEFRPVVAKLKKM